MTGKDGHACPGGCGRQIKRDLLACRTDWYRLPQSLRNDIWRAWKARNMREHRVAVGAAMAWYRLNPREASR